MSISETRIIFDDDVVVHEPEDPPAYGRKVAELIVTGGWISPNYVMGSQWQRTQRLRAKIRQAVMNHVLQMPEALKTIAVLRAPASRVLRLTLFQSRGPYPDVDNLHGGWKHLIDAMKKVQYRRVPVAGEGKACTLVAVNNGPGLIWDDSPKYLRIAEIRCRRLSDAPMPRGGKNFGVVEVYDWPEEEGRDAE